MNTTETPVIAKAKRRIFVIMPFEHAYARGRPELESFFENNLKKAIEQAAGLAHEYYVYRSGQDFNITDQIIRDLYAADIVIADLSGAQPNPNVMLELGIRFAVSEKPVILIREYHDENRRIFDVDHSYIHPYNPLAYHALEQHLIAKIARLERGEEVYESPVKKVLHVEFAIDSAKVHDLSPDQQREVVLKGLKVLGGNLARAIGPNGEGLAFYEQPDSTTPRIVRDGVDIAVHMPRDGSLEAVGVDTLQEAVLAQDRAIGDLAKTAGILCSALIIAVEREVRAGLLPSALFAGIDAGRALVHDVIATETAEPDPGIARAVLATATQDPSVAALAFRAAEAAGKDGVITFDWNLDGEDQQVNRFGYNIERGPVMDLVTEAESSEVILENPFIMLVPRKLQSISELTSLLKAVAVTDRPLLIIAEDLEGEVVALLNANNARGKQWVAIKAPAFGDRRRAELDDIAILTGAEVLSELRGFTVATATLRNLGSARRVLIGSEVTTIEDGHGDSAAIQARKRALRDRIGRTARTYEQQLLQVRLANLVGSHVLVSVGGNTEQQARGRLAKARNALGALNAALTGGTVPGGGAAYVFAAQSLQERFEGPDAERSGVAALINALEAPLSAIVSTARANPGSVLADIHRIRKPNMGFDGRNAAVADMVDAGILDPAAGVRKALDVAVATARSFFDVGSWAARAR